MKSAGEADGTRPASAAVLVHWLNSSVGEALPEALLVDQVEDLDDGVLLCKLACLAKPGISIQIIQDVFNEQEAIKNLSTAMRVAASLDSKIARACEGCRNPERIALTAFGGDTRKLVIALLRVFRDHLHQPKKRRSSMARGSKSKTSARSFAQSKTEARQKTHDSSRMFARSRPSSLPMRSPDKSAKLLRERPQWNGSVALSPSASAKDAKLQPKVHNDQSTEVSSVRFVANGELASARSNNSKSSACAADGLSPVNAGLVLSALRRLRQSTSGVTASYLASFDWLLHVDHLPRILRRLEQVDVPIYAPASSPPTVSAIDYVAAVLSDGILLSELARMSEPRLGATAVGKRKQPVIEKLFVRPDGATEKLLFYRGVSLDPRTTAARMKNVTVALESFRDRARMNHRHLYAADGIVKKQPPAIVWELIEDLRQSLPPVVARQSPAKQNVHQRNAAKVSVPDQNLQQSRPRSASLDIGSVDIAADHDRRVRTFSFQTTGQANGDASSCAEPQGSLRKQRHSHTSQTMRQLPAWSPPPPPQLQMPSSPVHAAPPGTLGSEEIAALASWLRDLGLHVPDDTHDCPLLEDVRFNGKLLLTLFSTLSEDAKAAYSQSGSLRRLQGAKVTSVQQAVDLVREALGEMRTAVAKTQPRPTSSRAALMQALKADPTEIARGREQAFWQLIKAVHRAFSKIKCSADVERRRAKVALLETREHGEEDVYLETRTERLDRTYKQTRDIVPNIPMTRNGPPNSKVSLRDEPRLTEGGLLPYTLAQLGQLEASLLGWLRRRGILEEICGSDGSFNSILGPPLLRRAWVDGSLLLRIIATICSDKPLRGLVLPAHTPQVEKANLEKALEYLRRHSSMGRRFLFSRDALWECDRMVVLGLLEDLHRLDAGLLPRPSRVVPGESPFLGTKPPRSKREQPSKQGSEQELANVAPELTATPTTSGSRGRRHPDADIWPSPFSSDDVLLYSRRRLGSSASCVSIAPEEDCASPWKSLVATPRSDIVPRPRTSSDFKRKSEHDAKPSALWASKVIPQEPAHAFSELSARQIDSLIDWVKRTSPKPVRGLDQLHQGEARILALSDGTVLAGMVEKLERIRGGLGGIQHKPKTVAAMLGNLRLALGRLQKNKRMKPDLLWSERELAAGNTRTWLALLADMHRAYV